LAIAIWRSGTLPRWAGVLFAIHNLFRLIAGDAAGLAASFAGQPEINDPLAGRTSGANALAASLRQLQLAGHHQQPSLLARHQLFKGLYDRWVEMLAGLIPDIIAHGSLRPTGAIRPVRAQRVPLIHHGEDAG
jgi:hypothetical protein